MAGKGNTVIKGTKAPISQQAAIFTKGSVASQKFERKPSATNLTGKTAPQATAVNVDAQSNASE